MNRKKKTYISVKAITSVSGDRNKWNMLSGDHRKQEESIKFKDSKWKRMWRRVCKRLSEEKNTRMTEGGGSGRETIKE